MEATLDLYLNLAFPCPVSTSPSGQRFVKVLSHHVKLPLDGKHFTVPQRHQKQPRVGLSERGKPRSKTSRLCYGTPKRLVTPSSKFKFRGCYKSIVMRSLDPSNTG